ncbi:MAG: hypothetical protein R2788_00670 [Saprospiraceae bacterium]
MKSVNTFSIITLFLLTFLFISNFQASAQVREPLKNNPARTAAQDVQIISPFAVSAAKKNLSSTVSDATHLQLNVDQLGAALKSQPREFIFEVPQKNGKPLQVLLQKQNILSADFAVTDQNGVVQPFTPGDYFTGYVLDRQSIDETNIAALSIVDNEVMAMMNVDGKNLVLGAIKDGL